MAKSKDQEDSSQGGAASQGGYGKRSIWQWIVIYIVLAVIIYGVIYYVVRGSRGEPTSGGNTASQSLY